MLKGSPVIMTMGDNNDSEFVTKFDYTLPSTIQIYIRWARIHQSAGPTMNFHTTNPILKGLKNHMQEITQKGYNFFRWAWRNVKKISGSILISTRIEIKLNPSLNRRNWRNRVWEYRVKNLKEMFSVPDNWNHQKSRLLVYYNESKISQEVT